MTLFRHSHRNHPSLRSGRYAGFRGLTMTNLRHSERNTVKRRISCLICVEIFYKSYSLF
ncbi:hypothetical protein [Campylobacter sp. CS_ED2]|uniref:hypothetical protein n=1 Tax=Campylobacter sp. CS_ED2 TaxID=2984141 RepID=UPI0022EA09EE|nr:hypothetical protein [Campylobacter sp. CS_ED2]